MSDAKCQGERHSLHVVSGRLFQKWGHDWLSENIRPWTWVTKPHGTFGSSSAEDPFTFLLPSFPAEWLLIEEGVAWSSTAADEVITCRCQWLQWFIYFLACCFLLWHHSSPLHCSSPDSNALLLLLRTQTFSTETKIKMHLLTSTILTTTLQYLSSVIPLFVFFY